MWCQINIVEMFTLKHNASNITDTDECLNIFNSKILWPLLVYLGRNYEEFFNKTEEHIFEVLTNHENVFSVNNVKEIVKLLTIPMLLFFAILLLAIIVFVSIPFTICNYFCGSNEGMRFKKFWFCILAILTTNLIAFLAFSTAGTLQMCLKLDWTLRNNLKTTHDLLLDLNSGMDQFDCELWRMNESTSSTLNYIQHMVKKLPQNVVSHLMADINNDMKQSVSKIKDIYNATSGIANNSEINKLDIFEIESRIKDLQHNFKNINVQTNMKYTNMFLGNNITHRTYKFPNLELLREQMRDTINSLPDIVETLGYTKRFCVDIEDNIRTQTDEVLTSTKGLKEAFHQIVNNVSLRKKHIYSHQLQNHIEMAVLKIKTCLPYLGGSMFIGFPVTSFILLIPAVHSCVYVLMAMCSCVLAIREIYGYQKSSVPWIGKKTSNNCTIFFIKFGNLFGVSLLWSTLVLSALCYLVSLSLSTVCRPIVSGHLYEKYTDNKQVWSNKTWLDSAIYPWGHGYKLAEVLKSCNENVTIYEAFEVQKYWNVSDLFRSHQIKINEELLASGVERAITRMEISGTSELMQAKDRFQFAENQMVINFTPDLIYDVEVMTNNKLGTKMWKMIDNLPAEHEHVRKNMIAILNDITFVESQKVDKILGRLLDLKYTFRLAQEEFFRIILLQLKTRKVINNNASTVIRDQIYNLSRRIKYDIQQMEARLENKIKNDIGNCKFIPNVLESAEHTHCQHTPIILNVAWAMLLLNSLLMILCMLFCNILCRTIIGIQHSFREWQNRFETQKVRDTKDRLAKGTLLFDRNGQLLGSSHTVADQLKNP